MMGPGDGYPGHGNPHHSGVHHSFPMDLHVHQGFPYYRQPFDPSARFPQAVQAMPPVLELRKEKSRDAARSRRGKENYEFYELAKMLPLPAAITSQLDKASIIRLTISYLRIKDFSAHGDPPWLRENPALNKKGNLRSGGSANTSTLDLFEQHQGTHILQSLDGFAFALAADGRFLYISETVSIYLGLSQVEMTGSSVFDYIHQNDHAELAEQLGLGLSHGPGANVPSPACSEDGSSDPATNNPDVSSIMSVTSNSGYKGLDRAFCIRMKSTLTKRGCHFKSSGYRVVLVLCRLRAQYSFSHKRSVPPPLLGMVALAIALPPPSVHEIRLESHMFVTKVTFDLRIIHCEPRVSELLDYKTEELTGRSLYALCHAEDVNKLKKCHVDLLDKGQVMSEYYRLLNKNGGYLWIQTCATVVSSSKNSDDQIIICVNYVISYSGSEFSHVVMDNCQLEQECLPIVKREVLTEDTAKMSPDRESAADGNGRVRDMSAGSSIWDSTRSPSTIRLVPTSPGEPPVEKKADVVERRGTNVPSKARLNGDTIPIQDSQPFTPMSPTIVGDNREVRTPQSVRSLDSEPSTTSKNQAPPVQPASRGRKRKSEKAPNPQPSSQSADFDSATTINHNRNHTNSTVSFSNHHINSASGHEGLETSSTNLVGRPIASKGSNSHENRAKVGSNYSSPEADNNTSVSGRWRKGIQQGLPENLTGVSSVSDLEHLMSKHLPVRENGQLTSSSLMSATDFSTESLLRQQTGLRAEPTIQWFGSGSQSTPGLPVSALLHRICASRESVIRANVHAAAAAAAVQAGRSYYPDVSTVASALPTPPDSDLHGDASDKSLTSHQKSGHPYSTTSSYDYRPVLTPPASVSPRDKLSYSSATGGGVTINSYEDPSPISGASFRPPRSYLSSTGSTTQPLPIKPQIYDYHPHSGVETQYGNPMADYGQSQFYPPPHLSFPLYHQEKPAIYEDALALKNANWYSATS